MKRKYSPTRRMLRSAAGAPDFVPLLSPEQQELALSLLNRLLDTTEIALEEIGVSDPDLTSGIWNEIDDVDRFFNCLGGREFLRVTQGWSD